MKKSLLAVAAIGAFASAAQAQSSVTVYGILDVGYIGGNNRLSSSSIAANGGQLKSTINKFGDSAESTSRLGFKGTEDLGAGTSAFFTLEFELYPTDSTVSGNTNGGLKNRQSFVGLKKNGLGQTAVGTQYTPVFNAGTATNPNGQNNMIGDLVYAGAPAVGTTDNAGLTSFSQTNRTSNTLTFQTEKFAGFSGNLMYTLNQKNVSSQVGSTNGQITSGGNTNATGWGLGADFTYNKFYVTAAYQALKQLTSASNYSTANAPTAFGVWGSAQPAPGVATPTAGINSVASAIAVDVQDNQFLAGTTYDFGILKAYAQYISRKATSTASSNYYVKRSAEQIGVRSYITPTIEAWASGSLGRYTAYGVNQPTINMNAWQLGSNYYLSKRTNLYAIYGQQLNSNGAAAGVTTSSGASNYAVGVRHTF
ncbi:porin [Polynucleobacter sp. MWH-UH35A]|uniref:porin n=1 Tax=Polynucleobacter sp. MWH-UH35A TaxID=1855619 RepID=UPI001BFDCD4A|nr:porin [Polynucleobacter sp. MWH-UH35A]QWD60242.1 porin [Polynucleobacter sp. MWH-UH35A]